MPTAEEIWEMPRREWRRILAGAKPLEPSALDNSAYRGVSLGLPDFIEELTWTTFQKVFYREPESGRLRGWNVRVEQRGLRAPSVARMRRDGTPWTFGHYAVVSPGKMRVPRRFEHAIVLRYGLSRSWFDPTRFMRDPIVAVNEGSADLLLGTMYVDFGLFTIPTPSWFTLEREGPLTGPPVDP